MNARISPRMLTISVALCSALAASPLTFAGKAVVTSRDGGSADFEYADGMLRVGSNQSQNSYMLLRDGTMYVVSLEGDQPMVFNASSMMKGMAQRTTQMAPATLNSEFVSLEDTGRDETIAGMNGDVYLLTYLEDNGKEQTEEMVLSTDARAREFRDALFSMSSIAEDLAGEEAMEQGRDLKTRMDDMNVGVLRFGQEMTVTSITGETIPAERFELPAQPMNLQGLGNILGNLGQTGQQGGGSAQAQPDPEPEAQAEPEKKENMFKNMLGKFGKFGKKDDSED